MNPNVGGMVQHAVEVWSTYVKDSGFANVSIVAHSAGGACVSGI